MKGICLQFYTYELQKHKGILLYEWILELARKNKIHGGSVFKSIAGYGNHGTIHEQGFFELGSDVPVEIRFVVAKEEADHFVQILKDEKIKIFYCSSEMAYGVLNG